MRIRIWVIEHTIVQAYSNVLTSLAGFKQVSLLVKIRKIIVRHIRLHNTKGRQQLFPFNLTFVYNKSNNSLQYKMSRSGTYILGIARQHYFWFEVFIENFENLRLHVTKTCTRIKKKKSRTFIWLTSSNDYFLYTMKRYVKFCYSCRQDKILLISNHFCIWIKDQFCSIF